jgi:hypothetical protein
VEDDRSAVSTNGSALHLVNHVPLIAGFYKVNKLHKRLIEIEYVGAKDYNYIPEYPEYKDIVKEAKDRKGVKVSIYVDRDCTVTYSQALTHIVRAMEENCMDIEHIRNLADGHWEGWVQDEHPTYLKQEGGLTALIMALKL